jgi:L-lactate dehydrogenase complex protein LldE
LIELPEADQCCGFGGTFAIKNPDVSAAMLSDKVQSLQSTGAEVCCGVDNSCLMQIFGSLHRQQVGIKTLHLAEILAETGGEAAP